MLLERLLDNLALELEAFAVCRVAPGWRLRLPALDHATFHYVVRGRGELRGGGAGGLALSRGTIALVPPGLLHGIQCGEGPHGEEGVAGGGTTGTLAEHTAGPADGDGVLVACGRIRAFYGSGLGLFEHLHEPLVLDFADDPRMRVVFDRLLEEVASSGPGSRAMTTALMSESLIYVLRRLCTHSDCALPWLQALEDPDLAKAVEAMVERPEQPHTLATLARLCFMSRSAFARRFREAFGQTPMEYLRGVRLRAAARLLRQSPPMPVHTVAMRVGFRSRSQFSRAFRDRFGRSPAEFAGASGET
jgi:AraC-like DNA-binding protein